MIDASLDIAARLATAIACGAVIGLNRDLHHKQAGVRTNALVSLGAALAVIVVMPPGVSDSQRIDALSRVIQGVLTGIGFLGAG
jgi:putative Mg2+ transporter-C (MgtC) family protein